MRFHRISPATGPLLRVGATTVCGLWMVLLVAGCGTPNSDELASSSGPATVEGTENRQPGGAASEAEHDPALNATQVVATPEDWRIARQKVRWAARELATGSVSVSDPLDFGELVGAIGESFLGATYVAHTLELDGPERLVVNLRGLDCVTFVETVLTLAHLARTAPEAVDEPQRFEQLYARALTDLRYRDGVLDGYPSRLHYFSDWIVDNAAMGRVTDLTRSLGGSLEPEQIDFMSAHTDAYPQLADPASLAAIRAVEGRLNETPRYFIPASEIADRAAGIRTGDVIAATSTVPGLDVAHAGLAVWKDGELKLLHAPLVGKDVQLSASSLAARVEHINSQDGILVARPVDPLRSGS